MAEEKKVKAKRGGAGQPRPLYILIQAKDANGNIIPLDKDNVTIVACSRNAGDVLEKLDGGGYEGVVYKKFLAS